MLRAATIAALVLLASDAGGVGFRGSGKGDAGTLFVTGSVLPSAGLTVGDPYTINGETFADYSVWHNGTGLAESGSIDLGGSFASVERDGVVFHAAWRPTQARRRWAWMGLR